MHRLPRAFALLAIFAFSCSGSCDSVPGMGNRQPAPTADPSVVFEHVGELTRTAQRVGRLRVQTFNVDVNAGDSLVVTVSSSAFDPAVHATPPGSSTLTNDDWEGSREHAQLAVVVGQSGRMPVAVTSYSSNARGRYRLLVRRVDPGATAGGVASTVVGVGQSHQGELAAGDAQLADGRFYEQVLVNGGAVTSELQVRATGPMTPMVLVLAPGGQQLSAGANGSWVLAQPGVHRVQVMSPAAGQTGGYTLSLSAADAAAVPTLARSHHQLPQPQVAGSPLAVGQQVQGDLAASDARLPTGEPADVYALSITQPNEGLSVELESSAFDPYLIIVGPGGRYWENDDTGGTLNAALSVTLSTPGTYRIVATAYRADEAGAYRLKVSSGERPVAVGGGVVPPTPAPTPSGAGASEVRGSLANGDQRLETGEFADYHTMQFAAGESVQLRLSGTGFDPYLIVRTPSGQQEDNDDFASDDLSSGLDIPVAEAGEYTVIVTSYRPGETGSYVLSRGAGIAVPRPNGEGGGGRVFGIFAGITDYPPGQNDLSECANDAIKLAEALRENGLLAPERQVVLTDAQATTTNIRSAFARMAGQVGPQDIFVFFWSGHGGQRGGSSDAREIDGTDETLLFYDGELVDDEVGRMFDGIRARVSLAALDSCYSGGFAKDIITRPGRVGMFSSEEDVLSAVAAQFQAGGYLSHFLRAGVSGEADTSPHDNVLTVGELTHHLYTQFGAHAQDVHLASNYQHVVIDRGAVGVDQVLWSYR